MPALPRVISGILFRDAHERSFVIAESPPPHCQQVGRVDCSAAGFVSSTGSIRASISRKGSIEMGRFKHVRTGITCVYAGLLLTVAAVLIVPLVIVPLAIQLKSAPLLLLAPLLVIAASLLSMIGRIFCLSVPQEVGATGLIYTAVVCDVSALIASVSGMVPGLPDVSAYSALLSIIGLVFFVLFLKKLAVYIDARDSAVRASNLLNVSVGLVVVMVAMIFLPLMALVALVLGLLGLILYSRLLSGMKQSLGAA
jgi:hypothetical protein